MRTIEKTIYTFDELDNRAKERAREWWRRGAEYPWWAEVVDSLKSFCGEFGVSVLDYSLGGRGAFVKTDATNENFRGLRLRDFDREKMPTGFCFDSALRYTFADEFKKHGDALGAFKSALDSFIREVESDLEWHFSDECADETITANGYEFDENGGIA